MSKHFSALPIAGFFAITGTTIEALFRKSIDFLFGNWHVSMTALAVFIVIDLVTGFVKGFYNKALRSAKMYQGLIRKTMIVVAVIFANWLDIATGSPYPFFKPAMVFFFIAMEGISIMENLAQMGVPLPSFIKERLEVMKDNENRGTP